jgi:uncharacterized damage-inducible protein DinB
MLSVLTQQLESTLQLLSGIDEAKANERYEPDKWSIKELVGHLIDSERVFAYRALWIARGDKTPLPGMDQDDFVRGANFDDQTLADLATEFELVRLSTLQLFKSLSDEAWERRGTASDHEVSVRALAFIIAGHEVHHMKVLRTRYLGEEAS